MINLSETDKQINNVDSIRNLISTPFSGAVNALCCPRKLLGDFSEIVNKIKLDGNIATINKQELLKLKLTKQGQLAREILINDLNTLEEHGASPTLNLIKNYDRDDAFSLLPTDVYSFHVDRSPIATDTFLCTYYGESSEIVPNSQATQKVLIPEIREELKKLYAENDEDGFKAFLSEFFFDLHYQAKPNAQIINLGIGNLWKLAIDYPESKVLPCLHRAPKEKNGKTRLLLIC
jgi:hypothetical protein